MERMSWSELIVYHCLAPLCATVIYLGVSIALLRFVFENPSRSLLGAVGLVHVILVWPYLVHSQHRRAMRSGRIYPWN
jgi:hypothetical protein